MYDTPLTAEKLSAWSERYNASPERRLATLALSKGELADAAFDPKGAFRWPAASPSRSPRSP